jgi:hypothetical protein
MHVNSLCACSHSEAMKGSSSLCLLILSRLLASPVWAQLTLTDPTWGAQCLSSKMATLSTGSAHTPLPGSRTLYLNLSDTSMKLLFNIPKSIHPMHATTVRSIHPLHLLSSESSVSRSLPYPKIVYRSPYLVPISTPLRLLLKACHQCCCSRLQKRGYNLTQVARRFPVVRRKSYRLPSCTDKLIV